MATKDIEVEGEINLDTIQVGLPRPKQQLNVRLDTEVIDWFKSHVSGYRTRMNAVLGSYVAV